MKNFYIPVSLHSHGHSWGCVRLEPEALRVGRYVVTCYTTAMGSIDGAAAVRFLPLYQLPSSGALVGYSRA